MKIGADEFRKALSYFSTGVCVITARTKEKKLLGITITSFTSLSLDPPLILFCLDKSTESLEDYRKTEYFGVNMLSSKQLKLSDQFAYEKGAQKWADVEVANGSLAGAPLIKNALMALECQRYQEYDGGDHVIIVGKVVNTQQFIEDQPLVRFKSRYVRIMPEL